MLTAGPASSAPRPSGTHASVCPAARPAPSRWPSRGPKAYIGGQFTKVDGLPFSNIAFWNGKGWAPMGGGTDGAVRALLVVGS